MHHSAALRPTRDPCWARRVEGPPRRAQKRFDGNFGPARAKCVIVRSIRSSIRKPLKKKKTRLKFPSKRRRGAVRFRPTVFGILLAPFVEKIPSNQALHCRLSACPTIRTFKREPECCDNCYAAKHYDTFADVGIIHMNFPKRYVLGLRPMMR